MLQTIFLSTSHFSAGKRTNNPLKLVGVITSLGGSMEVHTPWTILRGYYPLPRTDHQEFKGTIVPVTSNSQFPSTKHHEFSPCLAPVLPGIQMAKKQTPRIQSDEYHCMWNYFGEEHWSYKPVHFSRSDLIPRVWIQTALRTKKVN